MGSIRGSERLGHGNQDIYLLIITNNFNLMKDFRCIIMTACAVLTLQACDKEVSPIAAGSGEITFTMGGEFAAAVTTKATQVTTANVGTVYISAVGSSHGFTNTEFTLQGDYWKGGKYWPITDPSYKFYACNAALTVGASSATIAPADADTDIVVDYLASPSYKVNNTLTMKHIFAQIGTVTMKAPATFTVTDVKVSLQPITSGTYTLDTDTWSRGSAGEATYIMGTASAGVNLGGGDGVAGGSSTSSDNDLWLLPGEYQLTATYTIEKGDYRNSFTKHATVTLVQGKNNNLILPGEGHDEPNIPVPDDIADVTFSVTVTPWSDVDVSADFS